MKRKLPCPVSGNEHARQQQARTVKDVIQHQRACSGDARTHVVASAPRQRIRARQPQF